MRRKRVQVGWYCNHEHEPMGEGSHVHQHGKKLAAPSTTKALMLPDHRDPKVRPRCPLAVPTYILVDRADDERGA